MVGDPFTGSKPGVICKCVGLEIRMGLIKEHATGCGFESWPKLVGSGSEGRGNGGSCSWESFVGVFTIKEPQAWSGLARLALTVLKAKVLPVSFVGTEVGLQGALAGWKVLVKVRFSRARPPLLPSQELSVGAMPSTLMIWTDGRAASAMLEQENVLELPAMTGDLRAMSSCCIVGDVVPMGRANSGPGEGKS